MSGPAGALSRLYAATNCERRYDIGLEIAGNGAGAWSEGDLAGSAATAYLSRQSNSLGGGSNEMQRNIISERVLGMPREYAADRADPSTRYGTTGRRSARARAATPGSPPPGPLLQDGQAGGGSDPAGRATVESDPPSGGLVQLHQPVEVPTHDLGHVPLGEGGQLVHEAQRVGEALGVGVVRPEQDPVGAE